MNRLIQKARPLLIRQPAGTCRRMAGGHGGPPPTGWEASVRKAFPQDWQIVLATLGFYTTIGLLFKLKPSKKAPEAALSADGDAAAASSVSSAIPSVFDDGFDEWSKVAGNLQKWEKSLDDMEDLVL